MAEDTEKPAPAKVKTRGKRALSSDTNAAKRKPWTFPKNTLEEAIRVPKAVEEKNAGNPMPAKDLATAVGYRQASDWRFLDLLRSANQYGIVTGTGPTALVHLTKLGQDIVAPSSPSQRSEALLSAFRSVKDFEAVEKFYGGKRIPEDEFFLNTLGREFSIPRDRADHFAKVFLENLQYLRAFAAAPAPGEKIGAAAVEAAPRHPLRRFRPRSFRRSRGFENSLTRVLS